MKLKLLLLAVLTSALHAFSQNRMIVFLDEKPNEAVTPNSFSKKSIERRKRKGIPFDEKDNPVNASYLNELNQRGKVLNVSRWLNAVSYETALSVDELFAECSFIERIKPIKNVKPSVHKELGIQTKALDYGNAIAQIEQINLKCLHDMGYTGEDVYVAIIDAGFENMLQIDYFDTLYAESRVVDQHNFLTGDVQVYTADGHGTAVTSCIVGEKGAPAKYAGTAVDVDVALYLTEDVTSETEIEEFNLVAALERSDSVGADLANISLGYFDFDDASTSHVYADLDGNTTIAAMGVNVAVSKGIAVVMAAGNSGPANISTPCDADDGLCVGAIDAMSNYAFFSSVGPAADNQVKPDVAARGEEAWLITSPGSLTAGNGTSFASPIMAGATACLIQAHPTKSVAEIFDAIRMSASQYSSPDELIGYGIPDFCKANELLTNSASLSENEKKGVSLYPNPANSTVMVTLDEVFSPNARVNLLNTLGQVVQEVKVDVSLNSAQLDVHNLSNGMYTVKVLDGHQSIHKPLIVNH